MTLTAKGVKIFARMKEYYGKRKAHQVFYDMIDEGKLTGVEKPTKKKRQKK